MFLLKLWWQRYAEGLTLPYAVWVVYTTLPGRPDVRMFINGVKFVMLSRPFSLKLKAHFLHALPDLLNRDIKNPGDVLWCRCVDVSRLTFHADDILDVLFQVTE